MRINRKKSGQHAFLGVVIALALIVGVSYGVATFWQKVEDEKDVKASSEEQEAELQQQDESSEETDKSEESLPESSEEVVDSSEEEPLEPTSAPASEYADLGQFTGAVPPAAPVDNSYFDDAVFIGDSISTGIPLYQVMKNTTVLAMSGLNPSSIHTAEVIKKGDARVTILEALKSEPTPKKIYIMLGANGIEFLDKETMYSDYGKFLDTLKAEYPQATIYVQSILPVTDAFQKERPEITNKKIEEYNLAAMQMAKAKNVNYVHVYQGIADASGALPLEASPTDGMHLSPEYYTKWFDYLKTHTVQG